MNAFQTALCLSGCPATESSGPDLCNRILPQAVMEEINHKHAGQSNAHSTALHMRDVIARAEEQTTTKKSERKNEILLSVWRHLTDEMQIQMVHFSNFLCHRGRSPLQGKIINTS